MSKKDHYIHIIDDVISSSFVIHPLNDSTQNDLKNKQFFLKQFKSDVACAKDFVDISNKNNLYSFKIGSESFNMYIEHTDAGGRETSQKVNIPYRQVAFRRLIKNMEKVLVVDLYYQLKRSGGKLIPDKNKYCYLIVIPSQIYSSKPTHDILLGDQEPSPSSRWVKLQEIKKCINTQQTLMNENDNVWLVHPSNIGKFLKSVVIDDYKNQFKDAYLELLDLQYSKTSSEKRNIEKTLIIRQRLRQHLLSRKTCEIFGCNVDNASCLVASHIWPVKNIIHNKKIPWDKKFELIGDPNNAFLLCGTHDKLFDRKLITFNDNGTVIPSKLIKDSLSAYGLSVPNQRVIKIKIENIPYLQKHRELFYEAEEGRILL